MKSLIDYDNETLDDLLCGYKIIQPINGFRFSIDAVLLAHFATVKDSNTVVDFCSGSGVIAFLVLAHNKPKEITCVEVQSAYCDLIKKSIEYNNVSSKVSVINKSIIDIESSLGIESIDVVTCNPPYLKNNTGKKSEDESSNIARREVLMKLEDVIASASRVLKNRGRFAMVHLAQRSDEIFSLMTKYKIPVKRARLIQPTIESKPNLILVEGVKNASQEVKWLHTLNVYSEGKYSKEIEEIYGLSK